MSNRRKFIISTSQATLGLGAMSTLATSKASQFQHQTGVDEINIVGPKKGYSPQIGTMVSMMNWMRGQILHSVQGMSISDLDYLHDEDSNSIGAMLLHLAATEKYYQIHTFENTSWGEWPLAISQEWDIPMNLGEDGRTKIKGNSLDYYLEKLERVRAYTLQEFAKRDDKWLMKVDKDWFWGPTNNYCKWFHVCEHESNHNGQMKYVRGRIS